MTEGPGPAIGDGERDQHGDDVGVVMPVVGIGSLRLGLAVDPQGACLIAVINDKGFILYCTMSVSTINVF